MELRQLRYFVATVRAGTVSGAAQQLHVTQPGLSRQIRQLERGLGVQLFDRRAGRLALSGAGHALLPAAEDLLARVEAFEATAAYHAEGGLTRLTIAAPTVTLTDVVAPFVATLAPEDPTVDVLAADHMSVGEALGRGADLAIGTVRPAAPYASLPLAVLPVWAFVPAAHPWADRERVPLGDLLHEPLIVTPATSTGRQALDAAIAASDSTWTSVLEAANGTVAQALAAAGRGVAVVSDDPRYGLRPVAVELPDATPLRIRLVSTWDSRAAASGTLEDVARRLSAFVTARYDVPPA